MSDSKKIILVDVGNTSIEFALASGPRIGKSVRIRTADAKKSALTALKKNFPVSQVDSVVVASVVPQVSQYLKKAIPSKLKLKTLIIGKDIKPPILNRYTKPQQVGIDRLMNAVGFSARHKGAGIVIDFGTAITFDVVSKKGEYLGGVIAPGIEISIEALYRKTALLPRISLKRPAGILGRSTAESIQAGCAYGIGGLCDRVVEEIRHKIGQNALVAATGGYAQFMSHYCRSIQAIYPRLVLEGIHISQLDNLIALKYYEC